MKFYLLLVASTGGVVLAAPKCPFSEPKGHHWSAPAPNDSRSPCPGLNVLANHGYLPRSGRNIDIDAVRSAVSAAYNYAPATFDSAFKQAADFNLTTTGNASTFHLADLAKHDNVEFDGSLSRNDIFFGDNLHFDAKIWATTSARLKLNDLGPRKSDRYVTVEAAAKAQAARIVDAKKANPTFNASANQMTGVKGQQPWAAPKSWIRTWFESERIPYREGYRPPVTPRTGETIGNMFQQVVVVQTHAT